MRILMLILITGVVLTTMGMMTLILRIIAAKARLQKETEREQADAVIKRWEEQMRERERSASIPSGTPTASDGDPASPTAPPTLTPPPRPLSPPPREN